MESLQHRLESWVRDQGTKILKVSWGPLQWRMKWPWNHNEREHRKKIQEEYQRRKKQLQDLCHVVKAESVSDLQDILCCMVLSECVYKRPAAEIVRSVNKFKADFGGQVVSLERVQPSSDHVPHRYLLAEAGDTLFASFIGTKQYKDIMANANILQGAIFHEDVIEDSEFGNECDHAESQKKNAENLIKPHEINAKRFKKKPKPAAHRGFLGRAKGIPALELYKLAQKKKQKLVLCGHSLGGAVAALATLAILRVIASSSLSKGNENIQVKCITFSQPPVGNAALRDYVNRKGWQHHFKTYCIPEDVVPRLLSPAYFHHYNAQPSSLASEARTTSLAVLKDEGLEKSRADKPKGNEGEQLVLGLGPVQTSFWRLARLVPLEGIRKQIYKYQGKRVIPVETAIAADSAETSAIDAVPQSLEIQEGSDSISLKPFASTDVGPPDVSKSPKSIEKSNSSSDGGSSWRRMPYLPSYVPFGELYLLGSSSVEPLSSAEYSKLTSVRSVIAELRERLQSHSMKSYRSRFQRIYDLCTNDNASYFLGLEQLQQFPHLHQLLGLSVAGSVELGDIVESPVIRTATSIVPLGWNGVCGDRNTEPLKVDITGFGLHLCTLVQAQVNGNWCSTTVESFPSEATDSSNHGVDSDLQRIRVLVGAPLKRPPKLDIVVDPVMPVLSTLDPGSVGLNLEHDSSGSHDEQFILPEGLSDLVIFCTSDFTTVSKKVHLRMRRVRLLGLEGAGKTCLLKAILGQSSLPIVSEMKSISFEIDVQEGIAGGLCFSDSAGIKLQELSMEASRFRDELWMGLRDLSRKTDLIVLVHNLSHNIPRYSQSNGSDQQPVLSLLLDEAKALGIPWILAITNKFSVSAHQQKTAIDAVLQAYKASPSTTEVINSCPYILPSAGSATLSLAAINGESGRTGAQNHVFAPLNFVRRPFQRKPAFLPVEGVTTLCQNIHRVLRSHEEACLQEFVRDRLLLELARERSTATDGSQDSQAKANSLTAAAVGASLGAGLGVVLAVIMGAASALRKP